MQVPPPDPVEKPPDVAVTPCDPPPQYYFEGGLRRLKPYHYTYNTYCKERWRDRELLEIFTSEFRDRPVEYYVGESPREKREGKETEADRFPETGDRDRAGYCWRQAGYAINNSQERGSHISHDAPT